MKNAFRCLVLLTLTLAAPWSLARSDFPSRAITFVVPYPAGGPADLIARAVATRMSTLAGQPVIVENRAGASGNIAGEYVARAAKDGYTLLFGSSPVLVINPSLYKTLKFNPLKDFEPVADFGSMPNAVLVNEALPVNSIPELIAYSKANPATFASAGSGGTTHLSGLLFAKAAGVSLMHVPYKGSAPALQALLGNQVTMTFTDVFTADPFLKANKLKILGVTSAERSALLPQVRTLQEQGMKDIDVSVFFALLAPAGIPPDARQFLVALSKRVQDDGELQAQLKARGLNLPSQRTPEDLRRKMKAETEAWRRLITATGASID